MYKVDNYYTLYIMSHGFMEIILYSMLEASTRARTGDSAETIKLFENTFFFQMNRTHNTTGMLTLKQKLELVFIKHYAPNICLSPNMAKFAVS